MRTVLVLSLILALALPAWAGKRADRELNEWEQKFVKDTVERYNTNIARWTDVEKPALDKDLERRMAGRDQAGDLSTKLQAQLKAVADKFEARSAAARAAVAKFQAAKNFATLSEARLADYDYQIAAVEYDMTRNALDYYTTAIDWGKRKDTDARLKDDAAKKALVDKFIQMQEERRQWRDKYFEARLVELKASQEITRLEGVALPKAEDELWGE